MIKIAGVGCSLLDWIHADVDFSSPAFTALRSRRGGDGGLEPGSLVFAEDFERFVGCALPKAIAALVGGKQADACNIGGPGIVAMIHASQMLGASRPGDGRGGGPFSVSFTGAVGSDPAAARLLSMIPSGEVDISSYASKPGRTPFTLVLSDPRHDGGRGERCFINEIGAAGLLWPSDLPATFFDSTITAFGGTALTPAMHDSLAELLQGAKARGAFTMVNTVYDFRSQRRDPEGTWPMGSGDSAYASIDLLVTDLEEARRLSGAADAEGAMAYFRDRGTGAAVITAGTRGISAASWTGSRIALLPQRSFPVSASILAELAADPGRRGDTTGCGDNFAGGLIASIAMQLDAGAPRADLVEALAWGVASGGFACFHVGGVWKESRPGEKRALVEPYAAAWRRQAGLE